MAAFSTDALKTIQKKTSITTRNTLGTDLVCNYDLENCIKWINSNGFKKVALQFPNNLLGDSIQILLIIKKEVNSEVFLLGDTSYGSCCVDETAAQHLNADCVVHFGKTCLSPTKRLPVYYVFEKDILDENHFCEVYRNFFLQYSNVIILYSVNFSHAIESIKKALQKENPIFSSLLLPNNDSKLTHKENENLQYTFLGRKFILNPDSFLEDYNFLYIGEEGLTLSNFMMTYNKCSFYSYNPNTKIGRVESLQVNKALQRRYYLIERAKDANIVGIIAGTLGVSNYFNIILQLQHLLKKNGKKSYIFVVGSLSPEKLANFVEIDIFVIVACPENTLINLQDFFRPIVTPFEMEIACNQARDWTGDYLTDFRQLLPGANHYVEIPETNENKVDVSLITGSIRTTSSLINQPQQENKKFLSLEKKDHSSQLMQNQESLVNRSWKGLEQNLGQTDVIKVVEGRRGIAASYTNENTEKLE